MVPTRREEEIERRLEEILERYRPLLRAAISRACPPDLGIAIDDVEQEARLRIWRALKEATEIRHPASYLYKVAASATLDAVRRATTLRASRRSEVAVEMLEETEGPVERAAAIAPDRLAEQRQLLERARRELGALEPDRRRAVGLHLQGFTPGEIAPLLGWSEPKARSLVYRGLAELRARLAELAAVEERET